MEPADNNTTHFEADNLSALSERLRHGECSHIEQLSIALLLGLAAMRIRTMEEFVADQMRAPAELSGNVVRLERRVRTSACMS